MVVDPPAHGEVTFTADGRLWRLHMGVNALVRLEREVGDPEEIKRLFGQSKGDAKLETVVWAAWAGLQDRHPELTPEDAGNLVEHFGLAAMGGKCAEALILAFPPGPRKAARRPRPKA